MSDFPPAWANDELTFVGALAQRSKDAAGQKNVRRVQEWCTFHKYATQIDGDFGPATALSVSSFQASMNLPAIGTVDPTTWAALVAPLRRCLRPNPADVTENLYDVVVRTARRHYAELPVEVGGDNCGPWVRLYMQGKDGKEWAWCAGFACFVLLQANAARTGGECPIPYQVGVNELVRDAKNDDRFVPEAVRPDPRIRPGCLFVKRKGNDWYHTGLVVSVAAQTFQTIEGNTNIDGSSNGFEVFSKARAYPGTDFILLS